MKYYHSIPCICRRIHFLWFVRLLKTEWNQTLLESLTEKSTVAVLYRGTTGAARVPKPGKAPTAAAAFYFSKSR